MLQPVSVKTRDPLKLRVQPRRFHKRICPRCHKPHWTSAKNLSHLCGTCQRIGWNEKKADLYYGILGYDRRVTHGGSLAVRAVPVLTVGTCSRCRRAGQDLANGLCECCRFYGMQDDA